MKKQKKYTKTLSLTEQYLIFMVITLLIYQNQVRDHLDFILTDRNLSSMILSQQMLNYSHTLIDIRTNDKICFVWCRCCNIKQLMMKRVANRFWEWMFHPSVRPYEKTNNKASIYRYPSPGNVRDQTPQNEEHQDYKTPYEHSKYNIRYANHTPMQLKNTITEVKIDSLALTPLLKLYRTGLLKKGQQSNPDLLAAAKKKFQERFGFAVDQSVYSNKQQYHLLRSNKREDIAAYIQSFYEDMPANKSKGYDYSMNRKVIDDPETMPLQSVDMFVSPHFQQARIENQYTLDAQYNENVKAKNIKAHVGDARFWKAIDDSFESSEIKKVQTHVRDSEPNAFELRTSGVELKVKDGQVVDVHPKH